MASSSPKGSSQSEVRELRRALPTQLVDVPTAARLAGVSEKTIRRKIRSGEIPSRRIGRAVRVDPTKLRAIDHSQIETLGHKRAA
jgi:excisionase family DNA binding protein